MVESSLEGTSIFPANVVNRRQPDVLGEIALGFANPAGGLRGGLRALICTTSAKLACRLSPPVIAIWRVMVIFAPRHDSAKDFCKAPAAGAKHAANNNGWDTR